MLRGGCFNNIASDYPASARANNNPTNNNINNGCRAYSNICLDYKFQGIYTTTY